MKDQQKNKKRYKQQKAINDPQCYYCGEKKFEHIRIGSVNIIRCKNCGETQD